MCHLHFDFKTLNFGMVMMDGNVSVTEMMLNRDPKEEMMKAFKLFDDDDSGKISLRNLKRVARYCDLMYTSSYIACSSYLHIHQSSTCNVM